MVTPQRSVACRVNQAPDDEHREYDMNEERLLRERDFHNDRYAGGVDNRNNQDKYYFALRGLKSEYEDKIRALSRGSAILDYGCGVGEFTFKVAKDAASVYGIDISDEAIEAARQDARQRRLDHVHFSVADAHSLPFPDGTFDLVFGAGIIHHLDTRTALEEIHRVLKPGGIAVFQEPLAGNFAIRTYRALTPSARSADEHPLVRKDIQLATQIFSGTDVRYYGLTSLLSVPFRSHRAGNVLLKTLSRVDGLLIRIPGVRWQAWYCLMQMRK